MKKKYMRICALIIMLPSSVFLLLVVGLWLPLLCAFQIIYPQLDDVFDIEESIRQKSKTCH